MRTAALILAAAVLLRPLSGQSPPPAGTAAGRTVVKATGYPPPTNLQVLPKSLTGLQVREVMNSWSGDLGVRCSACHVKAADPGVATTAEELLFADDSNPAKAKARLMYTMTDEINSKFIANIENSGMPVTCGTCHQGQSSPAPFVAKLRDGLQAGGAGKPPLNPADFQNKPCTECHAAMAGPFIYPHAPMQAEGCSACHTGHGSSNPHLLIKADVDATCQQCHIPRPDPASGAHMPAGNQTSVAKPCTACHTEVHGSNRSPMFLHVP
jgi:predicted CXXCH cytochrome family protein